MPALVDCSQEGKEGFLSRVSRADKSLYSLTEGPHSESGKKSKRVFQVEGIRSYQKRVPLERFFTFKLLLLISMSQAAVKTK